MHRGRLVEIELTQDVFPDPGQVYTEELVKAIPGGLAMRAQGVQAQHPPAAGAYRGSKIRPGLRIPCGSSVAFRARSVAISAGLRDRCSQDFLSTPIPCSAEIDPP